MAATHRNSLVWDLESLLPHPESAAFQQILSTFRQDLEQLANRSDGLPPIHYDPVDMSPWGDFLTAYESVATRAADLESFVGCHAAADAVNQVFRQLEGQLSALEPLRERITTNIEFALMEATDEQLAAFLQGDSRIEQVEYFLRDRRRNAEVRLPKLQEQLASELAVDSIHAWGRLYDRLSGALRVQIMERGEIVEKSVGQIQFDSPDRSVRQNNFYASNAAWNRIAESCADALNHIAGTRLTLNRRIGIDHLEIPCRLNRLRRETLDTMWSVVTERKACLLPYLRKKAASTGIEKLAWYDVTAPYPSRARGFDSLDYADASEQIIQSFQEFSAEFGDFARRAIEDRWVEAEDRSGKRQGGFCTGFPTKKQSRIFMTFTNSNDSMSTLAHELGHAYHTFVLRDRPFFLQDYPMNLAETASTFAEAVLGEQRLRKSGDEGEKLEILDSMLSDAIAYLMNIHCRFDFEDTFYRERADGELSVSRLSELMLDAQKRAYLGELADDGWNPSFWISKLHFYISEWPFYNFPYTFGYLLSLGIYALGIERGEQFSDQYREFLIATGCQDTEDAVRSAFGDDLTKADFWNKSLDIIEERVHRFLRLAPPIPAGK